MNILVLGGTYFIGRILVGCLMEKGFNVTLLNRGTRSIDFIDVRLLKVNRHNSQEVMAVLKNKSFDVVIDLCGFNKNDVEIVVESLDCRISHYIFLSSAAIYDFLGNTVPFKEGDLKKNREDSIYGYNKWLAEQYLFGVEHINVTTLRPTYVYGEFDYSRRLSYVFEKIVSNEPVIVLGKGNNLLQLISVEDLADSIIKVIGSKKSFGQSFNVSGLEVVTVNDLICKIESVINGKTSLNVVHCENETDVEVLSFPDFDYCVDISKIEQRIGFFPKIDLLGGVFRAYNWWLNNKKILEV